jgi:hypothetical protein
MPRAVEVMPGASDSRHDWAIPRTESTHMYVGVGGGILALILLIVLLILIF